MVWYSHFSIHFVKDHHFMLIRSMPVLEFYLLTSSKWEKRNEDHGFVLSLYLNLINKLGSLK